MPKHAGPPNRQAEALAELHARCSLNDARLYTVLAYLRSRAHGKHVARNGYRTVRNARAGVEWAREKFHG